MNDTGQYPRRSLRAGLAALVLAIGLAACGTAPTAVPATATPVAPATVPAGSGATIPSATRQPTVAPPAPAAGAAPATAADAGGGEAGAGDEPTVRYNAPDGAYHFLYPRSWGRTTRPGEDVRFTGRDEFISVTVIATALGPLDYARADAGALATASPGFQGQAPTAYTAAGRAEAVVAYTWQAGPSPVTGKAVPSAAKRYYIAGPGGKLAVFTYSGPTQTYDPAGADDFANAFAWGK